jgi:beta-fructofuranosidase
VVELKGGETSPYGVKVFCSPDGKEETVIQYDPVAKELIIDFINSSVNAPVLMKPNCMREPRLPGFTEDVSRQRAPFELLQGETLKLDIFIDRSIIEVFANGRQCVTQVVYPEKMDSELVKLFSGSDGMEVLNMKAWKMAEI